MKLTYSKSGSPLIDMGKNGHFTFSKTTAHPVKGYKFLCFHKSLTNTVTISGAKAKKTRKFKLTEDINFTLNIDSMKRDGKIGPPKGTVKKMTVGYLKGVFEKHMNGVYLPFESIPLIEAEINYEDESDRCNDDPTATDDFEDAVDVVTKPKKVIKRMKPKLKLNGIKRKIKRK